ncbi:MAG: zinc metallopeptidase [Bacteroidetes bacterium]|nr:zinc metallopeptidase [Bacteroidota bacterium]
MLLVITIVFAVIGMFVSSRLKRKFEEFSQEPISSGLSGKEIAEKMLRDNNIHDVQVVSVEGQLTDHYNPANKTVNLSHDVYHGRNIAAAAVSAHECGHAVQHATAYAWLQMRSKLVPVVNVSSKLMNFVMIAAAIFAFASSFYNQALLLIIVLQSAITLFTVITLPVEIDASHRALVWLNGARIARGEENERAKSALTWAAMTYIVAALASIATLLYYVMRYTSRRD